MATNHLTQETIDSIVGTTVYVVLDESYMNLETENNEIGVFLTREGAEAAVAKAKSAIQKEWDDFIDDNWVIDSDEPGIFAFRDGDYDTLYSVWISEMTLSK